MANMHSSQKSAHRYHDFEMGGGNGFPEDEAFYDKKKTNADDRKDMLRMGKPQEMRRNFKAVTMFGFSVILMASWEVMLSTVALGLSNGGSAGLLYTNLATWIGFIGVYASMGEMGSMAPTSGGQYHWVSEFSPRKYQKFLSYITGWLGVLGWQTGCAFAAFITGTQIQGLLVLNYSWYVYQTWHGTLLIIAVLLFAVLFNTFLAQRLHLVEGTILVLHVCGFFGIMIPLWVLSPRASSKEVWTTFYDPGWNSQGLSSLVGIVASVAPLLGADAAAHMAEELQDASYTLPRTIVFATTINGGLMFIMAITLCYVVGDLEQVLATPTGYPFIQIFYNSTQSVAATNAMTAIVIVLSAFSCVTVMAGSSRQLFAFARDGAIPFSRWVSYVRPGFDVPVNSVIVIFVIAACISLVNIGSTIAFNIITSLGTGTLTTSYIICISILVWRKVTNQPMLPSRFNMGKTFGLVVNVVSLLWLCLVLVVAFFPGVPSSMWSSAADMNYAIAVYSGVLIFSVIFYALYGHKSYDGPVEYVRKLN